MNSTQMIALIIIIIIVIAIVAYLLTRTPSTVPGVKTPSTPGYNVSGTNNTPPHGNTTPAVGIAGNIQRSATNSPT